MFSLCSKFLIDLTLLYFLIPFLFSSLILFSAILYPFPFLCSLFFVCIWKKFRRNDDDARENWVIVSTGTRVHLTFVFEQRQIVNWMRNEICPLYSFFHSLYRCYITDEGLPKGYPQKDKLERSDFSQIHMTILLSRPVNIHVSATHEDSENSKQCRTLFQNIFWPTESFQTLR